MKKIIFSALCVLFIAGTGCNNDDKSKATTSDSSAVKEKGDKGKVKAFTDPSATDGAATIKNLTLYPGLNNMTQRVKFNYNDFKTFITSMNGIFGSNAQEIYLQFAALTKDDTARYIQSHPGLSEGDKKTLLNKPYLLIGYDNPQAKGTLIYKDLATICPPPTSCQTRAMVPNKYITTIASPPSFSPSASIDDFNANYNSGNDMTETVKFNIGIIDSIATANKAADIYFWLGAYTNPDAVRYSKSHTGNISPGDIDGKLCLLFATFDGTNYTYFDFGTICPPESSCKTSFTR